MKRLVRNSITYAFADEAAKTRLKVDLERDFQTFERKQALERSRLQPPALGLPLPMTPLSPARRRFFRLSPIVLLASAVERVYTRLRAAGARPPTGLLLDHLIL